MRRILIGDIQGCREELERLLEKVRFDPASDEIHPVGDFVNRGPESARTLRLLRDLPTGGVLGNHDLHVLLVVRGERRLGRRDTIQDLLEADDREVLLAWLAERPFVQAWPDGIAVHAGLSPAWKDPVRELTGRDPYHPDAVTDFVTRARYCDPEGRMSGKDWPPPPRPFRPWWKYYEESGQKGRWIAFGHWSRQGLLDRRWLKGLDTGCVWGNELTAWIPEEERLVRVPAARAYAGHED
ncbi:MAG: metallophosphoesterase [Planctomycetota bacterium]